MALNARLGADFGDFKSAIANVEVTLKGLDAAVKNSGRDLNTWVKALDGFEVKKQAELAAEAVKRIGDVSMLTAAEQAKVQSTVQAAIDKYKQMGQQVPPHLQSVADATRRPAEATESWTSAVAKNAAGYLAGMATWETAKQVLRTTVEFLKESVGEYAKSETGVTRLTVALRSQGAPIAENLASFKALAASLQATTTHEDDALIATMAYATQLGVLPTEMDKVIRAATDLASGGLVNLEGAVKMIVRADDESVTAFNKMGIAIDETRLKAEGMPYVFERITAAVGGQAAAEIETTAGKLAQLSNSWGALKEAVGEFLVTGARLPGVLDHIKTGLLGLSTALGDDLMFRIAGTALALNGPGGLATAILALGRSAEEAAKKASATAQDGAAGARKMADDTRRLAQEIIASVGKAQAAAAEKTAAAAKAAQEAQDALIQKIEHGEQDAWISIKGKVQEYGRAIDEVTETTRFAETLAFFDKVDRGMLELTLTNKGVGVEYWKWGQTLQAEVLPRMYSVLTTGQMLKGALAKVFADIPNLLQQAFTGGGGMAGAGKAVASGIGGALGKALFDTKGVFNTVIGGVTSMFGASAGAALGSILPGIGTAIGAIAGPLLGKLGGVFLKSEGKKVNDLRDQFIASAGGLDALAKKAVEAGTSVDALLRANKVKDFEAAVTSLTGAIDAQNKKLEEQVTIKASMAELESQIAALEASLVPTWEQVDSLVKEYGLNFDALGAAAHQLQNTATATKILSDYDLAKRANLELGVVIEGMGPKINALVQDSLKFKTELPENLKPALDKMLELGLLTDENGAKLGDLTGIKFGEPVKTEADKIRDAISALTEKLGEFIDKLADLTGVSGKVSAAVQDNWRRAPWQDWPSPDWPDAPLVDVGASYHAGGPVVPRFHRGGEVPAWLLAGEYVMSRRGVQAAGVGALDAINRGAVPSGGAITITVPVILDGREVSRSVARHLPGQLAHQGL